MLLMRPSHEMSHSRMRVQSQTGEHEGGASLDIAGTCLTGAEETQRAPELEKFLSPLAETVQVDTSAQNSATRDWQEHAGQWYRATVDYEPSEEPEKSGYMELHKGDRYFVIDKTCSPGGPKNLHWQYVYAHDKSQSKYGWVPWNNSLILIDYGRAAQWQ